MTRLIFLTSILSIALVACGGGGGSGGSSSAGGQSINSANYKLPTSVPSVPDQAGK